MRSTLRRFPTLGTLLIVALAGCTTPLDKPSTALGSTDESSGRIDKAESSAARGLAWNESLDGSVVYRLTVDGDPKTTCKLYGEARPAKGTSGWANFILEQTNGKMGGWMLQGGSVQEARVQAFGAIDSSAVLPSKWWGEPLVVEWPIEGFAGPVTLTFGALGLVQDGKPNLTIRFHCDGPHTIQRLEGGRDLSIFSAYSTNSGVTAGVHHLLAPTVALRTQLTHESKAPTVRYVFACSHFLARAELSTPKGVQPIECDPDPSGRGKYYEGETGPGKFVLDHNEVDPFDGGSWAVFYGVFPIESFGDVAKLPTGHGHACEAAC